MRAHDEQAVAADRDMFAFAEDEDEAAACVAQASGEDPST